MMVLILRISHQDCPHLPQQMYLHRMTCPSLLTIATRIAPVLNNKIDVANVYNNSLMLGNYLLSTAVMMLSSSYMS